MDIKPRFALWKCDYQATSVVDAEKRLPSRKQAAKEVSRCTFICLFINFGLFEARELDQNCLKSFAKACVEDQALLGLGTEHTWQVVSWSTLCCFPFHGPRAILQLLNILCTLSHNTDTGNQGRGNQIWWGRRTSHRTTQCALDTSSPESCAAHLHCASICGCNCWQLHHVDGILENYVIMRTLLFKTYFLNSIMWTLINSGRLRTGLWNCWLVYLINLLHQNTK